MNEVDELSGRLRRETADLHSAVEASMGLPGSIRSRDDYAKLLRRLFVFHSSVEERLSDPGWAQRWGEIGIDLARHRRAHLLHRDLLGLGAELPAVSTQCVDISDFPGALGCLYVVEGSSLGGRVIAPAIRRQIGDIPTSFFESDERSHPSPWRSLKAALERFGGDQPAVVAGARATFRAFERWVAPSGKVGR